MRAMRLRVECMSPARRKAMCCCVSVWVIIIAAAAFASWMVVGATRHPHDIVQQCTSVDGCTVARGLGAEKRDGQCPPGHTQVSWVKDVCVRRHWIPRVFDKSLVDNNIPVCNNVHAHACGAWDAWFDEQYSIVDRVGVGPTLDASLVDTDSIVMRFVTQWCRPLSASVQMPAQTSPDAWLSVQNGAQLPLWIGETHTLCLLSALNRLMPDWFYEKALGMTKSESLALRMRMVRLGERRTECASASVVVGVLGDASVVEISWAVTLNTHQQFYEDLDTAYGHAWTSAVAVAPYSWLAMSSDRGLVLRVALPRSRSEWLRRTHCERIASVAFFEVLEDRYTAAVLRQDVRPVLLALELCTYLRPRLRVELIERSQQSRADVFSCITQSGASNWHALVAASAVCNAEYRLQPALPLIDAFVPHMEAHHTPDDVVVRVTPAVFQPPLFSPEMEMPSVAARMYWALLREAAPMPSGDCVADQARDEWALDRVQECAGSLMDRQFWLELVQFQCGSPCASHWTTTLSKRRAFRREYKCA